MKQEKIAEWKAKGIDWLANQLWQQRNNHIDMNKRYGQLESRLWHVKAENEVVEIIKQQNFNIARILEESGIKPTKLRITYQEKDCHDCEDYDGQDCVSDFPDYECCPKKRIVQTVSFYAYRVDAGVLTGIVSDFKTRNEYDVLKIVDERTGEGIWEKADE